MSNQTSIGVLVRERRAALGRTRAQLAEAASVSPSTLARLELNDQVPNGRALARIARVLGCTVEELLVENDAVA